MSAWTRRVAARFGRRAATYDGAAGLQAQVAARLAQYLPPLQGGGRGESLAPWRLGVSNTADSQGAPAPVEGPKSVNHRDTEARSREKNVRVLEVGCGTGLFTRYLVARYGARAVLPTDASAAMAARVPGARVWDAAGAALPPLEQGGARGGFTLIAACMSAHWMHNPTQGLETLAKLLAPGGVLLYAMPAPGALDSWRRHLKSLGLHSGLLDFPDAPGRISDETHRIAYKSGLDFLRTLRDTGAATPRPGYRPLPPGALRRAARAFDDTARAGLDWVIRYGRLAP
jgi:malonyl-CoA O-methyltransferase